MSTSKITAAKAYKLSVIFAACMGILVFIPYLLLTDNSYVRIHDTLEGEWIWYHVLVQNGLALDFSPDAKVNQVMNGLPRSAYLPGLTMMTFWMYLGGALWGYVLNKLIVVLVAFFGMYLLLSRHIIPQKEIKYIIPAVSILFACIPFFYTFGITAAGQPLLLFAFLNLFKRTGNWTDFLIILSFPFYASLVWGAPAVLIGAGGIFIYGLIKERKMNLPMLFGILSLLALFILVNFQMLQLKISPGDFVSHRDNYDFFFDKPLDVLFSLKEALQTFFITHYHVGNFVTVPIFLSMFWVLYRKRLDQWMRLLLIVIISIALFYGFYNWIVFVFDGIFPILKTVKFDRITILLPMLWCLLFAKFLVALSRQRSGMSIVMILFLCQFAIVLLANDEIHHHSRQLIGLEKKPGFKEFFAKDLFKEIEEYIGEEKSNYRVVSLGINPSIAQYNGFYTLDGIQAVYDARYKEKFRSIMARELEKSEPIRQYFDSWGNRCYLYSAELGKEDAAFMNSARSGAEINQFDINIKSLQEMGGEFIFAGVKIKNAEETGLELLKVFEHPDSYWRIFLYKPR